MEEKKHVRKSLKQKRKNEMDESSHLLTICLLMELQYSYIKIQKRKREPL